MQEVNQVAAFRPYWMAQALQQEADQGGQQDCPPLTASIQADVCIVGGGFTGLWTAILLKQTAPEKKVVLLERDLCGSGASGRNGGCLLTWSAKYLTLRRLFGREQAAFLLRASEQAVLDIETFCREQGIDAELRRDGTVYTATSAAQCGAMDSVMQELDAEQLNSWQPVESQKLAGLTGSALHQEGVLSPYAGSVQPALLVRGLLRVARQLGVLVYEQTPMLMLHKGQPATVVTPEGQVEAAQVVLALNSWMVQHFREFRRSIVLVSSDMVITRRAPVQLAAAGLTHGRAIVDSRIFVYYYRSTPDGRLMLGKGGNTFAFANRHLAEFDEPSRYRQSLQQAIQRFFPAMNKVEVEASWCGASDRSTTGLPFFGHWRGEPNIVYGLGYSGNGVGQTRVGARILTSLVLGQDDEWSRCALVGGPRGYFPFEPVRWLGAMLVRQAIRRKERAEDAGGAVFWWDKQLARFAEAAGKADKA